MFIWLPNMWKYPHPPKDLGHVKLHTSNPFGLHPVGLSSCLAQRQTEGLWLSSARSTAFVSLGKEKKMYPSLEKEKVILKTEFSWGEHAPGNQEPQSCSCSTWGNLILYLLWAFPIHQGIVSAGGWEIEPLSQISTQVNEKERLLGQEGCLVGNVLTSQTTGKDTQADEDRWRSLVYEILLCWDHTSI